MNKSVFISITFVILLSVGSSPAQGLLSDENDQETIRNFDDETWQVVYRENFDSNFVAGDGQLFGTDNWLTFSLINGGSIEITNGYAQVNAPEFWNAALIRSTNILPPEYKIRTKISI